MSTEEFACGKKQGYAVCTVISLFSYVMGYKRDPGCTLAAVLQRRLALNVTLQCFALVLRFARSGYRVTLA